MNKSVLLIAINQNTACGLRYLSASLALDNINSYILYYFNDHPENLNILSQFIENNNIGIVGISVFSTFKQTAISITSFLKKKHDIPIVWGGSHVNSCPDDAIIYSDFIALQDCEIALREFAQKYFKKLDVSSCSNFWIRSGNQIFKNPVKIIEDIDALPLPDWDIGNKYFIKDGKIEAEAESQIEQVYCVFGSRGCPYECTYCANKVMKINCGVNSNYYKVRKVENIILEIEETIKRFPRIYNIAFYDELFGADPKWVEEFCQKYSRRINIPFGIISSPSVMNKDKMTALKHAGLATIGFGLQSGSVRMRKIYNRSEKLDKIREVNRIANKLKLVQSFDIIVDNPLDDKDSLIETLRFLLTLRKPFLPRTFDLVYLPQTDLTRKLLDEGYITKDQIEGNGDDKAYWLWRVDKRNLEQKQYSYIIALIQLTGNILIPNWAIKMMLKFDDKKCHRLKNLVENSILKESFYYKSAMINTIVAHKKLVLIKKIINRIYFKALKLLKPVRKDK